MTITLLPYCQISEELTTEKNIPPLCGKIIFKNESFDVPGEYSNIFTEYSYCNSFSAKETISDLDSSSTISESTAGCIRFPQRNKIGLNCILVLGEDFDPSSSGIGGVNTIFR